MDDMHELFAQLQRFLFSTVEYPMAKVRTERQFLQARCDATGRFVTITQRTFIRMTSIGMPVPVRQQSEFYDPDGRRLVRDGAVLLHAASGDAYRLSGSPGMELRWMAAG